MTQGVTSHFPSLKQEEKNRLIQVLKNVWTARYWWKVKYKVDPPILSADQMPLHQNESNGQKSLNSSGRVSHILLKKIIICQGRDAL